MSEKELSSKERMLKSYKPTKQELVDIFANASAISDMDYDRIYEIKRYIKVAIHYYDTHECKRHDCVKSAINQAKVDKWVERKLQEAGFKI